MTYKNLVMQDTTGTGTGNLTLTAREGWREFADAFGTGSGNPFRYAIRHQTVAEYEVGTGYMSDATTLVRSSVVDSSNGNAAVDFSAGTKDVMHAAPADAIHSFTYSETAPTAPNVGDTWVIPSLGVRLTYIYDGSSYQWVELGPVDAGLPLGMASVTVVLTDAQIKANPTTPVEIVPAPGAGNMLMLLVALVVADLTAVYTNIDADGYLNLAYGGGESSSYILNDSAAGITEVTQLLGTSAGGQVYQRFVPNVLNSTAWGAFVSGGEVGGPNLPFNLKCDNASGDYTGGHANNTLTVTVLYCVVPV